LPRGALAALARSWARTTNWLLLVLCGVRIEFRGVHNLSAGPLILASKHQSAWETIGLLPLLADPMYILKRELTFIPLFGWFLLKAQMIPVDRTAGTRSLIKMTKLARQRIHEGQGRQLIIFPEGTRRPVGAEPSYKSGVAQIYVECGVACVPVALNSGLFWPRRTLRRYPGTLIVEFLAPVPPGLSRRDFLATIEDRIETATAKLVEEGRRQQAALGVVVPGTTVAASD
jgi:1-acyl-sn-glycerol-3-phosphate acyltransferase